jgi:hypothetical protein
MPSEGTYDYVSVMKWPVIITIIFGVISGFLDAFGWVSNSEINTLKDSVLAGTYFLVVTNTIPYITDGEVESPEWFNLITILMGSFIAWYPLSTREKMIISLPIAFIVITYSFVKMESKHRHAWPILALIFSSSASFLFWIVEEIPSTKSFILKSAIVSGVIIFLSGLIISAIKSKNFIQNTDDTPKLNQFYYILGFFWITTTISPIYLGKVVSSISFGGAQFSHIVYIALICNFTIGVILVLHGLQSSIFYRKKNYMNRWKWMTVFILSVPYGLYPSYWREFILFFIFSLLLVNIATILSRKYELSQQISGFELNAILTVSLICSFVLTYTIRISLFAGFIILYPIIFYMIKKFANSNGFSVVSG